MNMDKVTSFADNLIYVHIETTGSDLTLKEGDPIKWERIIEIGAVKFKDEKYSEFHAFVNPRKKLPVNILDLCEGIDEERLKNSETIKEVLPRFLEFIEGLPIVLHNVEAEGNFLKTYASALNLNIKNEILSSKELAVIVNPALKEYTLDFLIKEYVANNECERHRALEDARSLAIVVQKIIEELWLESSLVMPYEFTEVDDWNWYKYIAPKAITLYERPLMERELVPIIPVNYDKYEELFRDEKLWQRTGKSYSIREQQIQVSEKIREGFEDGKITLIEAPTGIGKSMAYLLPAVIYSYKTGSKIIISTNTKGLQNQLVEKDIPNLLDIISLQNNINFMSIKGKCNYLCGDRFKLMDRPESLRDRLGYVYLYRYIFTKKLGDVEEINHWVRTTFNIDSFLDECTCESEYCDVKSCDYKEQCYYAREVEKLKEANIIIVNHSLLLKWPYGTEVEIKNLIADEAHNLKMEAYAAFQSEVISSEIAKTIREIYSKENKSGYLLYLAKKYRDIVDEKNVSVYSKNLNKAVDMVTESFRDFIKLKRQDKKDEEEIYDINESINLQDNRFNIVKKALQEFLQHLTLFSIEVNRAIEKLQCNEALKEDKRLKILLEKAKNLEVIKDTIDSSIKQERENYCYSYSVHKGFRWWAIKYIPLDVQDEFYAKVVEPLESGLFISATLTSGGNYEDFKRTLGFTKCIENKKSLVDIPKIEPAFKYKQNSIIYSPNLKADPANIHEFAEEASSFILSIIDNIKGNVLMLFTSTARLKAFEKLVTQDFEKKGIRILTRKGDLQKLKNRDKKYFFLGSRGFFEGVDIPGDAMNTVILDKVPNINGKEPLYEALIKRKQREDSDYFKYYNIINYPIVAIDIKQIYGRLMRTEYDYGNFIILSKFYNITSINRNLEKELYGVRVIRADSDIIRDDINRRYRMWKKDNYNKITYEIGNRLKLARTPEERELTLKEEYEKRKLMYDKNV